MKIDKLKLKDIVKNYEIVEQEFEYAGISGIAELLGWQIMFFRKKNLSNTIALSFNEIEIVELINIANFILKTIELDIRFGDNIEKIKNIYGTANFIDNVYEDMIRYNYIIASDLFIAFGIKNDKLSYLEIITDEELIERRRGVML